MNSLIIKLFNSDFLLSFTMMLPILGCENTKKQFLENFIFAKNENQTYQKDIDLLEKTLKIATTGLEMERTFICGGEEREDPRTVILNISGKEFRTKFSNFQAVQRGAGPLQEGGNSYL